MNLHQMHDFQPTEGEILFQPLQMHGVLKTSHFCSLCISSKDVIESLQKAFYRITAMIPQTFSFDQPLFFITFAQQTCLRKLGQHMAQIQGHKKVMQKFEFRKDGDKALTMVLPEAQADSWVLGYEFINKVWWVLISLGPALLL